MLSDPLPASIKDLAQIQIGGSAFSPGKEGHGVIGVTSALAEHRAESGHEFLDRGQFGGDAETSGTDVREVGPFFAPLLRAGAELKRHARRAKATPAGRGR